MKILSGALKGRNFYMPFGIRPTSDLVRKSVFDTLGQDLSGKDFLDLFAGSGAMGLEAVSRGARRVVLVEKDPKCHSVIEENLGLLALPYQERRDRYFEAVRADAFAAIKQFSAENQRFHLVFCDPPYGRELAKKTLKTLGGYDILFPNSFVILQHEKHEKMPAPEGALRFVQERKYGASLLTIYQKEDP